MVTNTIVWFFMVSLTFGVVKAVQYSKIVGIVTPAGGGFPNTPSNPSNNSPWPVPFYADNQMGSIPTVPQITPPPVQPTISIPASQMPPATIGRVNTIISSPAPVDHTRTTPLAPIVTIINPSYMLTPIPNTIIQPTVKQNLLPLEPIVTRIDPQYIIGYSSAQPISITLPSSTTSTRPSIATVPPPSPSSISPSSFATVPPPSPPTTKNIPPSSFATVPPPSPPTTNNIPKSSLATVPPPSPLTTNNIPKSSLATVPPPSPPTTVTSTASTVKLPAVTSTVPTSLTTPAPIVIIINPQYIFNTSNNAISSFPPASSASPTRMPTTMTPFTSNPISLTTTTVSSTTLSTPTSISSSVVTTPTSVSTTESKSLSLICNMTIPVSAVRILNPRCTDLNSYQVEVPAVIKLDVSPIPIHNNDSDVVEIISANSSNLRMSPSPVLNHINLDLSDHNLNAGWSTSPPATTVMQNRISQDKCMEYYSTGSRTARAPQVQVFIIGGQSSNQKEFPHMAALGYGPKSENNNNKWLCGGSLISELYVVTAAHCLSETTLGPVSYVRLGTTTLQTETLNSADYNVVRRIPYPSYTDGKQYDDIALLELDRPVTFTDYISPICLYTSTNLAGANLIATGWGQTSETGNLAKDLQKVNLDYVPNVACQQAYSVVPKEYLPNSIIDVSQVCAGTSDGSRDSCKGDSGGPLQLKQDGRLYLIGVTSFGIGCATPGVPGVYTRVSNYVSWIEQIVWRR